MVAPLAGAWIETAVGCGAASWSVSRPSRARGLKQILAKMAERSNKVAPLAGAWIETASLR